MKQLCVWYNPNKKEYYHRLVNGSYTSCDYSIGFRNSYNHELVYKIDGFDYYRKKFL